MKLKLDENVHRGAADRLRTAGFDVATVRDENLSGSPDEFLLETAGREGRCLVTLDLDFANTLVFRPSQHAGIVVVRLPKKPAPDDITFAVDTLIRGLRAASVTGKLWIVQGGRIREHQENGEGEP